MALRMEGNCIGAEDIVLMFTVAQRHVKKELCSPLTLLHRLEVEAQRTVQLTRVGLGAGNYSEVRRVEVQAARVVVVRVIEHVIRLQAQGNETLLQLKPPLDRSAEYLFRRSRDGVLAFIAPGDRHGSSRAGN